MIHVYKSKEEFLGKHLAFLEQDEVRNNLMIGIASRDRDVEEFYISSQINDEKLVGVISGKNMILASNTLNDKVYRDLIEYMEKVEYPGIIGPKEVCEKYLDLYRGMTGTDMEIEMDQRIYACPAVKNYSEKVGQMRLSEMKDFDVLLDWVCEFELMVEGHYDRENMKGMLTKRIEHKSLYVLEVDDELVSMAARSRPLKNTETVSLVYTPDHLRRRGYASRVVELLTEEIIKDGKIPTLYTDLSNPTSNSIYMKIGYVPHCDSVVYKKS